VEQIRRQIEKSPCVVVLWSKAAAESQYAQQEMRQAIQAWSSDRLVLAVLDDTPLPVGLGGLPAVSIRRTPESGTKELIERAQDIVWKWRSYGASSAGQP
jgi:TIR domain